MDLSSQLMAALDQVLAILEEIQDPKNLCSRRTNPFDAAKLSILDRKISSVVVSTSNLPNILLPVYRLPPEILAHIFYLLTPHHQYMDSIPKSRDVYTWTRVTAVSRFWRSTALLFPHLWTNIRLGTSIKEAARCFLHRSRRTPLHFFISSWPENWQYNVIDILRSYSHRVETLHVYDLSDIPREVIASMKYLKTLSCHQESLSLLKSDGELDYNVPKLTCLRMQEIVLAPSILRRCRNLTHLSLAEWSGSGQKQSQMPHLVDTLQRCPLLEELNLQGFKLRNDCTYAAELRGRAPIINLGQLQRLSLLKCNRDAIRFLFATTILPQNVAVLIQDPGRDKDRPDGDSMEGMFPDTTQFVALQLAARNIRLLSSTGSAFALHFSQVGTHKRVLWDTLSKLGRLESMRSLEELYIDGIMDIDKTADMQKLSWIPSHAKLRVLSISDTPTPHSGDFRLKWLTVFLNKIKAPDDNGAIRLSFPALHELRVFLCSDDITQEGLRGLVAVNSGRRDHVKLKLIISYRHLDPNRVNTEASVVKLKETLETMGGYREYVDICGMNDKEEWRRSQSLMLPEVCCRTLHQHWPSWV
ncbi:unnamed protein product [Somion occarium]|uniref:F-box domain-containing protein n=1 Tax=Somion occarium TaxID=3059160 RepID=A0ABP1DTU9_9APHY